LYDGSHFLRNMPMYWSRIPESCVDMEYREKARMQLQLQKAPKTVKVSVLASYREGSGIGGASQG
jgi:hypothetical protein